MNRLRSAALSLALAAFGCGQIDGIDPVTSEGTAVAQQNLLADDLYNKLRQLETILPPVPAQQTVSMGSWVAGGNFVGLGSTCTIVFQPFKHKVCTPPTATINAVAATLVFNVGNGVTLTANGKTAVSSGGQVSIDVGNAATVDWKLQQGTYSVADKLFIARPDVGGVGAFTVAALPVTIVYEPPMNTARTNSASTSFGSESTVVDTITNGSSTSSQPEWAEGQVAKQIGIKLANKFPQTAAAYQVLKGIETLWGSVGTTTTYGTEVNTDHTLSVKVTDTQTISTLARLGPGRGDLIVFYKNARIAWGMDAGKVSLTLIDQGGLSMFTVETLKADLTALANGLPTQSGLDADSINELVKLSPMANPPRFPWMGNGVTLATGRYPKDATITVNGATYAHNISHTISTSDKVSKLSTTTTVKDYHPGWLTLIGVGQTQAGKVTTKLSYGASRTVTASQTKSSTITLGAAANETYSVDVHYDNIFGTFLSRNPPAPIVVGPIGTFEPSR